MKGWSVYWSPVAAAILIGLSSAGMGLEASSAAQTSSLNERIKGADKVVVATAREVASSWRTNEYGDRIIVTRAHLEIEEVLKGAGTDSVVMEVTGGTLDGITLRVSGQAVMSVGDRAVYFLERPQGGVSKPYHRGEGVLKLDSNNFVRGSAVSLGEVRMAALYASRGK